MTPKQRAEMAKRVAARCFVASSGTDLSTVFLSGTSKARMAAEKLQTHIDRGMKLINDSTHKEHIYAEAGDMITETQALLHEIMDGIAILSYAAAKLEEKKLRNDVPAGIRDRIDDAVKRDT